MDELDQYGPAVRRYQGMGQLQFEDGSTSPVFFEARQTEDSGIVIGCLAPSGTLGLDPQALSGFTTADESFTTDGSLSWTHSRVGSTGTGVDRLHLVCNGMRIRAGGRPVRAATRARFALQNFVFGQQDRLPMSPLIVDVRGLRVTITPVDEYIARSSRLRRYGGIAQTAWCDITDPAHPQGPLTPKAAEDLMNELIHPLSLALGTLVSWHECQALDASGSPIEVIHRSKVTRSFSNEVVSMGWHAPVPGVVSAWFAQLDDLQNANERRMSLDELVVRIRHHLDACATDSYLETRALSAATLLDVLAGRHAELIGKHNTVPPEQWETGILPHLTDALKHVTGLTKDQRNVIEQHLQHLYRRSFGSKLHRLLKDVGVRPGRDLSVARLEEAIRSRNELVHNGHFAFPDRDQQVTEYSNLLLLGRSIVLRLAGYPNDLQKYMARQPVARS